MVVPKAPAAPRTLSSDPHQDLEPSSAPLSASTPAPSASLMMRARTLRPRFEESVWPRVEAAASRLGRKLDGDQRRAIRSTLDGNDALVIMADSTRSADCYRVPALLLSEPTIVLSPVPEDLKIQAETLSEQRAPFALIQADCQGPERAEALRRIKSGGALLVLLSPEALAATDVREALAKSGVALFVIEEAHCVSAASHELRPSYTALAATLRAFGNPPAMAVTRSASSVVRHEIIERLELAHPVVIETPVVRENLTLVSELSRGESRPAALVRLLGRLTGPGVVFCATPHDVDSVYATLAGSGVAAHRYHTGMTPADRAAQLANFMVPENHAILVALSAFAPGSGLPGLGERSDASSGFGRGVLKTDLRFVVHYQSPASLEQYLREIHLAGVDGAPATCVMLHESSHRSFHEVMLAQQRFKPAHLAELGRALENHAEGGRPVSLEALALGTGQSRRTTDRLTALLADAGLVSKASGWITVKVSAEALSEACRKLGGLLYALREQDSRRLSAVTAYAENGGCKRAFLNRYQGALPGEPCGHCSGCSSEILPGAWTSVAPQASARRPVVQEFSTQSAASGNAAASAAAPLTVRLMDFRGR